MFTEDTKLYNDDVCCHRNYADEGRVRQRNKYSTFSICHESGGGKYKIQRSSCVYPVGSSVLSLGFLLVGHCFNNLLAHVL
jgi:hypothetical protein